MATTYRKLSEIILNQYLKGIASDDASYSLRHVAEMVAMEVAFFARKNAFENSNAGSATYANDQFISVWNNLPLLIDEATHERYVDLPATPTSLPNNQEIQTVTFTACPKCHVVPMQNKDRFAQSFLPQIPNCILYFIEDSKIKFDGIGKLATGDIVSVKMIGSVPGNSLLDSVLNVPKDVESSILDKVLSRMNMERNVQQDQLNDSKANPN